MSLLLGLAAMPVLYADLEILITVVAFDILNQEDFPSRLTGDVWQALAVVAAVVVRADCIEIVDLGTGMGSAVAEKEAVATHRGIAAVLSVRWASVAASQSRR